MNDQGPDPLSKELQSALEQTEGEYITLELLIDQLGNRAYGILFVLLTIPNAIPISGFTGISTLTGILLVVFAIQMAKATEKPLLPKVLAGKQIKKSVLQKSVGYVIPYLQKLEPYIKPRWAGLSSPLALRITGWVIVFFALIIITPIPFSNFGPALAIFVIGLGVLEKDGLFIAAGLLLGILYCSLLLYIIMSMLQRLI